jgi:[ribosomal protein S18]-alanine N-acetyltransferase
MDEIVLHEMETQDIPPVLEIERMSFTEPWSESAFLNELLKSYAFNRVAVKTNRVIGYICVNYILDEGHILNLAVHPDFRRQGIATRLMSEAIHALKRKECDYLYLEVRTSNSAAKKFYERFGFGVAGIRKDYYISPKEDALIMMGRLKEAG